MNLGILLRPDGLDSQSVLQLKYGTQNVSLFGSIRHLHTRGRGRGGHFSHWKPMFNVLSLLEEKDHKISSVTKWWEAIGRNFLLYSESI